MKSKRREYARSRSERRWGVVQAARADGARFTTRARVARVMWVCGNTRGYRAAPRAVSEHRPSPPPPSSSSSSLPSGSPPLPSASSCRRRLRIHTACVRCVCARFARVHRRRRNPPPPLASPPLLTASLAARGVSSQWLAVWRTRNSAPATLYSLRYLPYSVGGSSSSASNAPLLLPFLCFSPPFLNRLCWLCS